MSFSGDIKEEIAHIFPEQYHCLLAEIAGIILYGGAFSNEPEMQFVLIETENITLAKKYLRLIKKAFDIDVDFSAKKNPSGKTRMYRVLMTGNHSRGKMEADDFAKDAEVFLERDSVARVLGETCNWSDPEFASCLLEYDCCRRAFIRGAFLAAGSMSDPGKSYHFEVVCRGKEQADGLCKNMESFGIHPKQVARKNKQIVYFKDSTEIIDMLNIMGAHKSLMELENVRIIKDMRNSANRQYNCDSANINKMVRTATRQLEDIRIIQEAIGLSALTPQLKEMAEVRLAHPEISLKELGEFLNPPVGKSGVNHRLKKLGEIAQNLRAESGE